MDLENFFNKISQINIQYFIILNKALNYSIIPYFLSIFSIFFEIKIFLIFYVSYIFYFHKKSQLKSKINKKTFFYFIKSTQCYFLFVIIFYIIKKLSKVPRPFCILNNVQTILHNLDHSICYQSFPSAHTGLAFLLGIQCWKYAQIWQKFIIIITIFLASLSRISLALHFPLDLISSLPITLIIYHLNNLISRIFFKNL
ncbi:MAG: phosphatase PAP2 family protein [Rickettsia sp.]|nr:phosphatase PAP2 family protein [Rickettsia sp.]